MKKFIVQGSNWFLEIEIDDDFIEKRLDKGWEAATRAIELYLKHPSKVKLMDDSPPALGPFMVVQDKGNKNEDETMIFLTETICRNAGKHNLADSVAKLVKHHYKNGGIS